jgi:hypothetical protein
MGLSAITLSGCWAAIKEVSFEAFWGGVRVGGHIAIFLLMGVGTLWEFKGILNGTGLKTFLCG